MKIKIILIAVLLIALLGSTIVLATDDLDVRSNINVNDLVGDEILDDTDMTSEVTDDGIMPISILEDEDFSIGIPEEYWRSTSTERGDVYVLESNCTIDQNIDGNLYILASQANINADVDGNVFILANTVNISGNVSGSVYAAARSINISSDQIKDVYLVAQNNIILNEGATITREAKMIAESIVISGAITGNLYSDAPTITLQEGALITGKAVYSGTLSQATEGQVGSLEKYEHNEVETAKESNKFAEKATNVIFKTFTALFIIGLIVLVSDKKVESKITVKGSIKGVLGGVLWIILIPIISVILMITVVGVPFSIILLMLYVLMFFIAIPAMSLQISAYILNIRNKDSKILLWLLATVIYCGILIVRQIPKLGGIITILVGAYGFNLIIKTLFSKKKKENVSESQAVVIETKEDK